MRKTITACVIALCLSGCANITATATFQYPAPVVAK